MKCEFGYCTACDKEIAPPCPHCRTRKAGGEYTEVEVQWSNGSRMKVALCVECAVKNAHSTPGIKEAMTQAHFQHWDKAGGTYDKAVVIV